MVQPSAKTCAPGGVGEIQPGLDGVGRDIIFPTLPFSRAIISERLVKIQSTVDLFKSSSAKYPGHPLITMGGR